MGPEELDTKLRSGAVGQRDEIGCSLNALAEYASDLVFSYGRLKLCDREGGWSAAPYGGDIGSGHMAIGLDEPVGEDVELWAT